MIAPYRVFVVDGRPSHLEALAVVREALADEGLTLGAPGQTERISTIIDAQGDMRVLVPSTLIQAPSAPSLRIVQD